MGIDRWFLKLDVRLPVAAVLLILAGLAPLGSGEAGLVVFTHLVLAVTLTLVLDFLITGFQRNVWFFPRSALITGLLIGLVHSERNPLWLTGFVSLLAIGSKHLLRIGGKHLLNPAATGLVAGELLAMALGRRMTLSWWGVSAFPAWTALVLAVGMGLVLARLRILALPIGFLLVYAGRLAIQAESLWQVVVLLVDPTVLLFSLVMLSEYKTSPIIGIWRYAFGIFTALIWIIVTEVLRLLRPDPLLVALVIGNALSFLIIRARALVAVSRTDRIAE